MLADQRGLSATTMVVVDFLTFMQETSLAMFLLAHAEGITMLTQAELHSRLDYDSTTGIFRWKQTNAYSIKNGQIAGHDNGKNAWRISINQKQYLKLQTPGECAFILKDLMEYLF